MQKTYFFDIIVIVATAQTKSPADYGDGRGSHIWGNGDSDQLHKNKRGGGQGGGEDVFS